MRQQDRSGMFTLLDKINYFRYNPNCLREKDGGKREQRKKMWNCL